MHDIWDITGGVCRIYNDNFPTFFAYGFSSWKKFTKLHEDFLLFFRFPFFPIFFLFIFSAPVLNSEYLCELNWFKNHDSIQVYVFLVFRLNYNFILLDYFYFPFASF